ncbi:HAD family hydrolase [Floccifex sp.]|uniref:HAD family hydrolase n=1 Tax=Floccifex sp. TaxID=2815810 RepID=UPI003F0D32AE
MNKWNTIIFDMDGTLFDTEQISLNAWYDVKEHFNLPITRDFCIQLIGRTRQSAQPIFKKYMPENWNEQEVYAYRKEKMNEFKLKNGPLPKTDLHQLFNNIRLKGYRIALCSSSHRDAIDFNLKYEHLENSFDVIVDGSMTNHGKPAPDIYLKTAELLNIDPSQCLVIEDSKNGILSAHRAGMDVMMVIDLVQPDEEVKSIAYKIYNHLDDILKDI